MAGKGKLFVVSAPSGAGKTTLIRQVLKRFKTLSYSVSHTTRAPRSNEEDGLDYFFISPAEFEEKIAKGLWLEWAKVHDNYYGTSKSFVKACLQKGKSLLLDIDVQGAEKIMASGLNPVSIFIMPPSFEVLSQRLLNRGTDSKEVIEKRLVNAKTEMALKDLYRYVVVNDDLNTALKELYSIFKKEMDGE
ncbi:MAG: guanylate kinase [Desulfobacterales bacterium RIFOXYA12_FULL_46_15]|nr:MAG: guanylate kinase [Desulfobacterales bacterium RIFOXYA12_FULL_46_15]